MFINTNYSDLEKGLAQKILMEILILKKSLANFI